MKKTELIFNLVSIPVDTLTLLLAGVVSFYLRQSAFTISLVGPINYTLQFGQFINLAYKFIPAIILIFASLGLYNLKGTRKFSWEIGRVIVGASLSLLLVILIFFFNKNFFSEVFPSRFIILATWALGIILVMLGRLVLKQIQITLFKQGFGLHKLVIIDGSGKELGIVESVFRNSKHGYQITGEFAYSDEVLNELEGLYQSRRVDEILQANANLSEEANLKLVQFARDRGLKFSFVPNLFEVQRNIIETDQLNGIPLITLKNTPLDGWGRVAKRTLDVVLSAVCLILTSPVFLVVTIVIRLDSQGKAIYSAMRGGRGKDFKFYKFRTMFSHLSVGEGFGGQAAEQVRKELWQKNNRGGADGPFLKIKNDPRVTRVGRFLRRSKLDEIPQFWNVLVGDMSMVGPRAHVLDEVERYRSRYARMFSIKPGIFGLSQMAQVSWPDLPFEEEIRLNTFYIENWSLWLDLKILTQSFWLLFFEPKPKGDY